MDWLRTEIGWVNLGRIAQLAAEKASDLTWSVIGWPSEANARFVIRKGFGTQREAEAWVQEVLEHVARVYDDTKPVEIEPTNG